MKCLLTEKFQNKYFDHAFFCQFCDCLLENDHLPYSLTTMVQDTSKSQRWGEYGFFFFFFFFFFFSDECCPQCDLEKINHCVNGVEPVSIYRDWLASLFQSFFFFFHAIYTCIQTYIHADILTFMSIHAICTCMYACSHTNIFAYPCITHLHACTHSSILF